MRRLGLVGRFAIGSAAAFLALGLVLALVEAGQIRSRALTAATDSAVILAELGVQPHLTPVTMIAGLDAAQLRRLDEVFATGLQAGRIARIKVWTPTGKIVYSDDHSLIGRTFPLPDDLREALDGHTSSDLSSLTDAEDAGERSFGQLLEVYLPISLSSGGPDGAFELGVPYRPIARVIASDTRRVSLIIVGGLVLLWAGLFRMVLGASRRLKRDGVALRKLALHDQLTDLPNRLLFRDRVEQAIRSADREGTLVGVLMMDLDRFKEINDALGHDNGDRLLKQIGPRLATVLRSVDTVARLGGDEFGIVLGGLRSVKDASEVATKITASLETPFEVTDLELEVGASIGIAVFPDHGQEPDDLMRRADVSMYVAKAARGAFAIYSPEQDRYTKERLALVADLRRAIETGQIDLHYQPKLDLARARVIGVEALARWSHPERGAVPPDVFVPLAEHAGLIRDLTSHVIESALLQCRAWRDAGITLPVAVNLSVRDLIDAALPDEIVGLLERYGLEPAMLELEITESTVMDQPGRAIDVLDSLSRIGLPLAIDDFGTGYSSLAYLQRLPVRELKIDRSFVMGLRTNDNDDEIVRSTIDLAHNLGLSVVAEGVEDRESVERLTEMGCDVAQGYYIARPMPAADLEGWLIGSGLQLAELVPARAHQAGQDLPTHLT